MSDQHYPIISVHVRFDPWRDPPSKAVWISGFGRQRRIDFLGPSRPHINELVEELHRRWPGTLALLRTFDTQDVAARHCALKKAREEMRKAIARERGEK